MCRGVKSLKANPAMLTCNCRRLPELINLPHGQALPSGLLKRCASETRMTGNRSGFVFCGSAIPLTQRLTELWPVLQNLRRLLRFGHAGPPCVQLDYTLD